LIDVTPGFMSDMARAINSSGQIVGGGSGLSGFTWDSREGFTALPALPGVAFTEATDVNERGQIAGRSGSNAVIWQPDGSVVDLGTFGGDWVLVTGINNRGQVVGSWFGLQLYHRGFLWDPRQGAIDLGEDFQPEAINQAGEIVGVLAGSGPAFMDSNGDLTLLPLPESFRSYGRATDINNRGVIVGYVDDQDWVTHAVMWIPSQ
jgi:probable HAF family extracellular repeat protein